MLSKYERQPDDKPPANQISDKTAKPKKSSPIVLGKLLDASQVKMVEHELVVLDKLCLHLKQMQEGIDRYFILKQNNDENRYSAESNLQDFVNSEHDLVKRLNSLDKNTKVGFDERFFNRFHLLRIRACILWLRGLQCIHEHAECFNEKNSGEWLSYIAKAAKDALDGFAFVIRMRKNVKIDTALLDDLHVAFETIVLAKVSGDGMNMQSYAALMYDAAQLCVEACCSSFHLMYPHLLASHFEKGHLIPSMVEAFRKKRVPFFNQGRKCHSLDSVLAHEYELLLNLHLRSVSLWAGMHPKEVRWDSEKTKELIEECSAQKFSQYVHFMKDEIRMLLLPMMHYFKEKDFDDFTHTIESAKDAGRALSGIFKYLVLYLATMRIWIEVRHLSDEDLNLLSAEVERIKNICSEAEDLIAQYKDISPWACKWINQQIPDLHQHPKNKPGNIQKLIAEAHDFNLQKRMEADKTLSSSLMKEAEYKALARKRFEKLEKRRLMNGSREAVVMEDSSSESDSEEELIQETFTHANELLEMEVEANHLHKRLFSALKNIFHILKRRIIRDKPFLSEEHDLGDAAINKAVLDLNTLRKLYLDYSESADKQSKMLSESERESVEFEKNALRDSIGGAQDLLVQIKEKYQATDFKRPYYQRCLAVGKEYVAKTPELAKVSHALTDEDYRKYGKQLLSKAAQENQEKYPGFRSKYKRDIEFRQRIFTFFSEQSSLNDEILKQEPLTKNNFS